MSDDGDLGRERRPQAPGPPPWGPLVGVVLGFTAFFVFRDLGLILRLVIAFAVIAAVVWLSVVITRRR